MGYSDARSCTVHEGVDVSNIDNNYNQEVKSNGKDQIKENGTEESSFL